MNDNPRTDDSASRAAPSRRAFLTTGARFAALGGLAAVTALLGRRARDAPPSAETCGRKGVCSGCGAAETCGLPAAQSRRRAGGAS